MIRKYLFPLGTFALLAAGCHNSTTPPPVVAPPHFTVTALAADAPTVGGFTAANVDANLKDSWGLAFNSTYGFPWVANRASGTVTIYDALGVPKSTVYSVYGPGQTMGTPTGLVQNTATSAFLVPSAGIDATWLTSQLNGTIAAVASGDSTYIVVDRSSSSSFTGLAEDTLGGYLYAPNIKNGSVDQFDRSYNRAQFSDGLHSGQGYVPFNAVELDTQLYVTEAKPAGTFVAIGAGFGGYVNVYGLAGGNLTFEKTLITNDSLDQPWGVAIAPSSFGAFSGDLLVGNFGDGTIHAYNRSTGAFVGTLTKSDGSAISIPGLWALVVYNGTLYFTAGPNAGADGIFGTITAQ